MAIKNTSHQQMRQDRFDDPVKDLLVEFTVGGIKDKKNRSNIKL